MGPSIFLLLLPIVLRAQTLELHGRSAVFGLHATLEDESGRGHFFARRVALSKFEFEYLPISSPRTPRELHLTEIFGRERIRLGLEDVALERAGQGVVAPREGVSGYYLRLRLLERARRLIPKYRYLALGLGSFGKVEGPHHVLLQNDEEDYLEGRFKFTTWHRLDVGERVFRESLLECEARLSGETR